MSQDDQLRIAQTAFGDVKAARTHLGAQRQALAQREDELANCEAQLGRLLDLEKEDHVRRLLDGEAAAPKRPQRLTRISTLQEQIPALRAAIPVLAGRIRDAEKTVLDAETAFGTAVAPILCARRSEAVNAIRVALDALRPQLLQLISTDRVQRDVLGRSFAVEGPALEFFSGEFVANNFVRQLPARLRPKSFDLEQLAADANHQIPSSIATLRGDKK